MFGLDDKTLHAISEVLKKYSEVEEAKIFGSRALGTQRPNSDIDIALVGKLDPALVSSIKSDLDEISTPFQFDVVGYNLVEHKALKDHIDRIGKSFYRK